jgi:hypothetical protein
MSYIKWFMLIWIIAIVYCILEAYFCAEFVDDDYTNY